MKHTLIMLLSALMLMIGGREMRQLVLTPTPQMHCQNCENKIKSNMRFEKGITKIETSIEHQTVAFTYDPAKTNSENIQAAMKKIGYDTKIVSDQPVKKTSKGKKM